MNHVCWWTGVASRGHLPYGVSWLRELLRRDPGDVELRLFPARSFHRREAIPPAAVEALLDDPRVTVVPAADAGPVPKQARLWLLSTGAVGIKPWLRLKRRHPTRPLTVVVTDEGLGTYGDRDSRHRALRREGVREPWATVRAGAVHAATRTLTSMRWPLHVEGDDGWGLNRPVAEEFRRHAPEPDRSSERVVFLSQPWPESGVMSEERYLDHVEEVARATTLAGLDFVVLPHPGEPPGRHAAHAPATDGEPALAEWNPLALGARVVVGASSTAMVNLAALHGVPAVRVGTPELTRLDLELAPRQASLLAHYAAPSLAPAEFGRRLSQGFGR